MRDLQTQDLFAAARVVKEIGIKDELKEICQKADNVADVWGRGYDFVYMIFEKAAAKGAEMSIYEFIGGIMGKTAEEIKTGNLLEILEELLNAESVEKWKAFLRSLQG